MRAQYDEAFKHCEALEERIEKALYTAEVCNRRERIFGQLVTDFSGIETVKGKFMPHNQLWSLASQYFVRINIWMLGEISELDGDTLPKEIIDSTK